ncbi:MAG: hypothetical protein OEU92_13690 [Alphaproteobacteria bacterium]|nr:hypothetical protein [Alphaproteobacteria bacterium]
MLLIGFQIYGARAINPAEEIVKRLDGRTIGGERVSGRILPVDYRGLEPAIRQAISETTPLAVICLGLWPPGRSSRRAGLFGRSGDPDPRTWRSLSSLFRRRRSGRGGGRARQGLGAQDHLPSALAGGKLDPVGGHRRARFGGDA